MLTSVKIQVCMNLFWFILILHDCSETCLWLVRGRRPNVSGQLSLFGSQDFTPLAPSRLSGPHKIQKFVGLSIQKTGSKLTWYFHEIARSFYIWHNLRVVQLSSRKYYYGFANLWVSKIVCMESRPFVYLPLTFQNGVFTINLINTQ